MSDSRTQVDQDHPSSSEILIFNNCPYPRIASVLALAVALVGIGVSFTGSASRFVALPSALLLFRGYVGLTRVEELTIDFRQHIYELRTGGLGDAPNATGSLGEFDHLKWVRLSADESRTDVKGEMERVAVRLASRLTIPFIDDVPR